MRCARAVLLLISAQQVAANVNIDGGRSDLPGMKQDMFDQAQKAKKAGNQQRHKAPPECPKSDHMTPFVGLAFVNGEMYVKLNSTEEKCQKLLTVGGANYSVLTNASRTCGPAGEWKRRIAEELSAVFFQGGLEWVKYENETIEVVTEEGTFEVEVSEEKYATQSVCWIRACGCEQANNPIGKAILITLACIGIGGLLMDSFKLAWKKFKGVKPGKHVLSRKGHKVEKGKFHARRVCNVCGKLGTTYECSAGTDYYMADGCYKAAKKKVKTELEEWYEKHPEDKEKDEQKKKDKKDKKSSSEKGGDSDDDAATKDKTESEAESTSKAESKAESSKAESEAEEADASEHESKKDDKE